jgi:flagellar protein FliS
MTQTTKQTGEQQISEEKAKNLLKVFESVIRFTQNARKGMEDKNLRLRSENIAKVINILTELDCALDLSAGGELAGNLSGLYRYMMNRLTHANIHEDLHILEEVEKLLTDIKDGFVGAYESIFSDKSTQNSIKKPEKERGLRIEI